MGLNRKHLPALLAAVAGAGLVTAGVASVYGPAGLIVGGLLLLAFGLIADVDGGDR